MEPLYDSGSHLCCSLSTPEVVQRLFGNAIDALDHYGELLRQGRSPALCHQEEGRYCVCVRPSDVELSLWGYPKAGA